MARQAADTAVSWWCWNVLSGGRIGCGPTMTDESDRWKIALRRVLRAVPRWLLLVAVSVWAYLELAELLPWFVPAPTSWPWLALVAVTWPILAALAAVAVTWLVCRWWHRRRWYWPLAKAFAVAMGRDVRSASRWLNVPRGLQNAPARTFWRWERPAGIILYLGGGFQAKPKETEQLENLTRRKLAVPDEQLSFTWQMRANWSYLQIRSRVLVPDAVLWGMQDVREAVESTRKTCFLGLGAGESPVAVDLDDESPHLMFSAGTGAGKSVGIRSVVAQLVHDGATCFCLDIKRHSHPWLVDVPGVVYVRDLGDVHNMLLALQTEGDRRNRMWDGVGLDDHGPTFPRLAVLLEEIGQTTRQLKRYWSSVREYGDPPVSPAIDALAWLLQMGRQVRLHVIGAIQMGTAKDLGGTEIRENFGVRALSHYSKGAWKMLAGDIDYVPSVLHRGRFQIIKGTTATETQLLYMSPHEARDYARAGTAPALIPASDQQGVSALATLSHQGKQPPTVAAAALLDQVPRLDGGPASQVLPLKAIAPLLDTNASALARALQRARARGAPAPVGRDGQVDLYDSEQVAWWHRNRPRTGG